MAWLNESLSGSEQFGLTAPAVFGFSGAAPVHGCPLSVIDAAGYVQEWLGRPQARPLAPGPEHVRLALGLLEALGTGAILTTYAQLAAYAMEFGGTIHLKDSEFGRFPGLRWVSPLA